MGTDIWPVVLELVCVRDCIPKGKFMDGMGSMLVGLGLKKSHFAMRAYSPYFTVVTYMYIPEGFAFV